MIHPRIRNTIGILVAELVSLVAILVVPVLAQDNPTFEIIRDDLPREALARIDTHNAFNVSDAPLKDVFRAMATAFHLNLSVDDRIQETVTVRLGTGVVIDALEFLCTEYGLNLVHRGDYFRIEPFPAASPVAHPPEIVIERDRITARLDSHPLADVLRLLTEKSGQNIVPSYNVKGELSGYIEGVPLQAGVEALLTGNGFRLREMSGIWYVDYDRSRHNDGLQSGLINIRFNVTGIRIEAVGARLEDVITELRAQIPGLEIIQQDLSAAPAVTAFFTATEIERCLQILLHGSPVSYRKDGDVYILADKSAQGQQASRLVRLNHLRSETALDYLPEAMKSRGDVKVVREQNGLLATGTDDWIREIEAFVSELDSPVPQILIEALVVDFTLDNTSERGMSFSGGSGETPGQTPEGFVFSDPDGGDNAKFNLEGGAGSARKIGSFWSDWLGLSVAKSTGPVGSLVRLVGKLPDDFHFRINALAREGRATIRSRPQASTLNGHTARLSFGETQYFLLNTTRYSPYGGFTNTGLSGSESPGVDPNPEFPGSPYGPTVTQQFQTIEANVSFEITPWVGLTGEITAEIKPDFKTPQGGFQQGVPPTISSRSLESTVRLRDGETIILGGLIQDKEQVDYHKVPILGDIPLVGRLFRNRRKSTVKQELVIFVTPHVFFGDQDENEKWKERVREFDFQRPASLKALLKSPVRIRSAKPVSGAKS